MGTFEHELWRRMVMKPVLICGDMHAPYHHELALDFIEDTYNRYGCGSIVVDGDGLDHHAMSRFCLLYTSDAADE